MNESGNSHKNFWIITIVIILVVVAGFLGYKLFRIEKITVIGNTEYSSSTVAQLAAVPVNTHMLVIDRDEIKANVESDPYLVVTAIDFAVPNELVITVKERVPVAKFESRGKTFLLSDEMLVISDDPARARNVKITVTGLNVADGIVGEEVKSDNPYKAAILKDLFAELKNQQSMDMITEVDVSDVNNIKLMTAAGYTVMFGQGDSYESKIQWIRKMIVQLDSEGKRNGTIDVSGGDFATYSGGTVDGQMQISSDDPDLDSEIALDESNDEPGEGDSDEKPEVKKDDREFNNATDEHPDKPGI